MHRVVGRFTEAGHYLGKEDFELVRTGLKLRIKGNPNADPNSLVAGLDETLELPGDSDFERMGADFYDRTLTVTIPRVHGPQVALPPELMRALESLSPEEAQALVGDEPSPELMLQRLRELKLDATRPLFDVRPEHKPAA